MYTMKQKNKKYLHILVQIIEDLDGVGGVPDPIFWLNESFYLDSDSQFSLDSLGLVSILVLVYPSAALLVTSSSLMYNSQPPCANSIGNFKLYQNSKIWNIFF